MRLFIFTHTPFANRLSRRFCAYMQTNICIDTYIYTCTHTSILWRRKHASLHLCTQTPLLAEFYYPLVNKLLLCYISHMPFYIIRPIRKLNKIMPKYCIYICIFMPRLLLPKVIKKCSCKFLIYYNLLRTVVFVLKSLISIFSQRSKKENKNVHLISGLMSVFGIPLRQLKFLLTCFLAVVVAWLSFAQTAAIFFKLSLWYICAHTFHFRKAAMWLRVLFVFFPLFLN